jgi:outer membrane protein assembly factor BamB
MTKPRPEPPRRTGRIRGIAALAVGVTLALATACAGSSTVNDPGGGSATPVGTIQSGPSDWSTYHHDAARTGVDLTSPTAGKLTQAWSMGLDGAVYAEPLVVGSVVYVATESNSVYALDADSGKVRWVRHLATPVDGVVLPCGNIDPSGITGTPVIDVSTKTLYVVVFESTVHHKLFALSTDDGSEKWSAGADPTGVDPSVEQQRGALSLVGGRVLVPYGGLYGDCGDYHGFVLGFPADGQGRVDSFQVPNEREAGIWAPPGATAAPDGSVLVATGNGSATDGFDDSDSVIRLSSSLDPTDVFAPKSWASLNEGDLDLGTTSPAIVDDDLVLQVGKEGTGYLLRLDHLGGLGGAVHSGPVCSSAYGGTAVVGSTVYVACIDGLHAVQVHGGDEPGFTVARTSHDRVGPPIVSGGVIWVVTTGGELEGFDLTSGRLRYRFHVGEVVTSFPSLAAAHGMLFVPSGTSVKAYRGV